MDKTLKYFLEDYQMWLEGTKANIRETITMIIKVKSEVNPTKKQLAKLDKQKRHLFQTNYFLMESHLRIHNIYNMFSDEDKKFIDEYENVSAQANNVVSKINEFLNSYKNDTTSNQTL